MVKSVYISGIGPQSGKSVVVLGLMEFLSRLGRKIGFFRPVTDGETQPDRLINLITSRYRITSPYERMYGSTYTFARDLIVKNREEELYSLILEKYKTLEYESDFVVSVGTDYTGVNTALEFQFNIEVARNLGSPVIPVMTGQGRTTQEIVNAVRILAESLEEKKCDILSIIVNRVAQNQVRETTSKLKEALPSVSPVFIIPEVPLLQKPTVAEIQNALGAELLYGDAELLDREVVHFKVAAMELPHFLDHLEDGSLIITPGDRSDIIIGTLLAHESASYPRVAGIVLTGDLKPAQQIHRLINGLKRSPVPVLSAKTDTFTTAMAASSLHVRIGPENKRKIAAALSVVESYIDFPMLENRIAVTRSSRITPLMFEHDLITRARADRRHIVLPEGTEERILRAAEILVLRNVVDITLLGNTGEVKEKITALGLSLDGVRIIDPASSELREGFAQSYYELRRHKGITEEMAFDIMSDVSYFGTMMVYSAMADGMVSGSVHTTQHTIRPAFEIIKTKPGCVIVSSVFFICLADRVLVYGDCAVNPDPDAEQLADIAISSAMTAQMFGIEPRVAMLSYSTGESGKGADVDKVIGATHIAKRLRPDLKLEGPLQYDAAIDPDVAKIKLPDSEVAGHATVFIFPDLNTGNNTYKAVQRSANAVAIGPVLQGLKKPVNDLSRGCTVTDIVNTVAITAIQAQSTGSGT